MPTINQLSAINSVSSGDLIPVYSSTNGDARKASMSVISDYVASQITASDDMITQYAGPNATGFSVQVVNDALSIWLILTPLAAYAAGTLILPSVSNCADRQRILVNSTQAVTALTVNGNGSTVVGAPTTLAANAFFRLRFDRVMLTWYRVG